MEPEPTSMQPHCVGAAIEPPCERVDVGGLGPHRAEHGVLGGRVAACAGAGEAELPPPDSDLLYRPPETPRESRRRQLRPGRLTQQRILERRPRGWRASSFDAERTPARGHRVLGPSQLARDRLQRGAGQIQPPQASVLMWPPAPRHVRVRSFSHCSLCKLSDRATTSGLEASWRT